MRNRIDSTLAWLLIGVAVFHFWTMPRMYYSGDNYAARAETAGWLMTGKLGLPYSERAELGGLVEKRGQYLFENDAKQRLFSKYGFGYTLLYAIPLSAEKCWRGVVRWQDDFKSGIFFIVMFQILLCLISVAYIYWLAALYTEKKKVRALWVLAIVYGTFVWHYLRAPTLEVFQVPAFLCSYYHVLRFVRGGRAADGRFVFSWMPLLYSGLWLAYMLPLKLFYVVQIAVIGLYSLTAGEEKTPVLQRMLQNVLHRWGDFFLCLAAPCIVTGVLVLFTNWYRFGSVMETGYGQWMEQGKSFNQFSLKFLPEAFRGYFFSLGNASAFVHFPVFAFALLAIPRFARQWKWESIFALAMFLSILLPMASFQAWTGEWCYGPRYLVLGLIPASLPFIQALEFLGEPGLRWPKKVASAVAILILSWSFVMQFQVNSVDYFVHHRLAPFFGSFKQERIDKYIQSRVSVHRGYFCADVIAYRDRGEAFYPLTVLRQIVPPDKERLLVQIEASVQRLIQPNFLFAK